MIFYGLYFKVVKNANLNAAEYERMAAILQESTRQMDEYHEEFKKHIAQCEKQQRVMFDRFIDSFEYNLQTGENYDQAVLAIVQFAITELFNVGGTEKN